MTFNNKRLPRILMVSAGLLLIPFVAMQITTEVNWSLSDFAIAGILLIGSGLLLELVLRKIKKSHYRTLAIITIVLLLLLIWAELAVGVFGTPFAGS
ncbi:MAG: hypothetical protein KJN76_06320 [Eudoraea sp.]|nr:hypothetical protein [Eudoraea sp.]